MCKVLIIPAIKEDKRKNTNKFIYAMSEVMSKANGDGLGYAAVDKDGKLFAEHWFHNYMFLERPSSDEFDLDAVLDVAKKHTAPFGKALKTYGGKLHNVLMPPTSKNYKRVGTGIIEKDAVAITLHTRAATCDKTLANVHPFVDVEADTSIIHNGVIHNDDDFNLKLSTCDSESILISYLQSKVNMDINNATEMVGKLWGYYAVGAFSRDAQGNRVLDVFKANNWNLSIAYVYELGTYVLTSSSVDLENICNSLGFSHGGITDIADDIITRINPFTGEVIAQADFISNVNTQKPKVNTNYQPYNQSNIAKFRNKGADILNARKINALMTLTSNIRRLPEREVEELEAELLAGSM